MAANVVFRSFSRVVNLQLFSISRPSVVAVRCYAEKVNIPTPPKKPTPPYLAFYSQNVKLLKNDNPGFTNQELSKKAGAVWRSMSEDDKQQYSANYMEKFDRYKTEKANFINALTSDEFKALQEKAAKRKKRRKLTLAKAKKKSLNKPKHPGNSFSIYIQSRKGDRHNATPAEHLKLLSVEWNAMKEEEKQVFKEESKQLRAKYQHALTAWEQKMIVDGHPELVRGYIKPTKKTKPKKKKKSAKKISAKSSKTKATQTDTDLSWMKEE